MRIYNTRAVIIGIGLKSEALAEIKESLSELDELAAALGLEVVGSLTQHIPQFNPATLLGSGKVEEIKKIVDETGAGQVLIDHVLTGVQTRNLEKELGVKVRDRNQVILEIFAARAQTYEGKLQVELATMLDQLPRMVDAWMGSLSRLGGGIGTRGPGETALELDRRRIRERMRVIRKQLDQVRQNRSQHRASRRRNQVPCFALIGYTNSGKSTLLNALSNANVMVKDQVFATLDPTTRKVFLGDAGPAVVTDTVGFIRKLPANLIEAFKATLEESAEADVLLHVIDLANPQMNRQVEVVEALMQEFGWDKKPIIHVFNKMDAAPFERQFQVRSYPRVFVSGKTGEGLDRLKRLMSELVGVQQKEVELFFPKSDEHRIFELGREAKINRREPASQGTICLVQMTPGLLTRWKQYLVGSVNAV